MSNCGGKQSNLCGSKVYAECTEVQTQPPSFSSLYEDDCISAENVIEDVYELIGGIKEEIDVTGLINGCITFTNPKTSSSVIAQMYAKLCALEALVESQTTEIADLTARVVILEESPCI